jgi:hypothetical protein
VLRLISWIWSCSYQLLARDWHATSTVADIGGGDGSLLTRLLTANSEPSPVKVIDLQMLVVPGGQERTEADWHKLLGDGGFKLSRIVAGGGANLIEALPA